MTWKGLKTGTGRCCPVLLLAALVVQPPAVRQLAAQQPAAQQPTSPPPVHAGPATAPPPVHSPQPVCPPAVALEHLRAGNARLRASTAAGEPVAAPQERPAGAGRWIAAVLVCADAGVDVPALLGLLPRDMLLLSVPGAFASAEITAALERAAASERLSLCVVLTHADCQALAADQGPSTAAQLLSRRGEAPRSLAATRRLAIEKAQALVQREQILGVSAALRQLVVEDRFRIVPASVDPQTLAVTWHTTRAEELPIAPVK